MLFATVGQGPLFIWMMIAGIGIGAWYAVMALIRRILQAGILLTLLCDLVFGIGSALILLGFMILGNYGQVRLFSFAGAALGLFLFAFALAGPLKRTYCRLEAGLKQIWTRISKNRLINIIFR